MKGLYLASLLLVAVFSINFSNLSAGELFQSSGAHQISVAGSNFTIPYSITGGTVTSITADQKTNSLQISLQPVGNGDLQLVLPRLLIDSQENGQDSHLLVLINNHGINYSEASNSTVRVVSIPITNQTNAIKIVGTQVIPEFGQLSYLVLTISIMSTIILFSYKKTPSSNLSR
jgi:predicted secreted protein with PEFG-CTERM motif